MIRVFTEEHKRKLSDAKKRTVNNFLGKRHSDATRKAISHSLINNTRAVGHVVSNEARLKISKALTIENPGYEAIHTWLRKTFGKADLCESTKCSGVSNKYHYALRNECVHARDRNNYLKLCTSCHATYDNKLLNFKNRRNNS